MKKTIGRGQDNGNPGRMSPNEYADWGKFSQKIFSLTSWNEKFIKFPEYFRLREQNKELFSALQNIHGGYSGAIKRWVEEGKLPAKFNPAARTYYFDRNYFPKPQFAQENEVAKINPMAEGIKADAAFDAAGADREGYSQAQIESPAGAENKPEIQMAEKIAQWKFDGDGKIKPTNDEKKVIEALKLGHELGVDLSPEGIDTAWRGLRAAMETRIGSYNEAMQKAGLDPYEFRKNIRMVKTATDVDGALRKYAGGGRIVTDIMIWRKSKDLHNGIKSSDLSLDETCEKAKVKIAKPRRIYTSESVVSTLKAMAEDPKAEKNLIPGNMIRNCRDLYRSGLALLGGYEPAMLAAGLDPQKYLAGMAEHAKKQMRFVPKNVPAWLFEKYPYLKTKEAHAPKKRGSKKIKDTPELRPEKNKLQKKPASANGDNQAIDNGAAVRNNIPGYGGDGILSPLVETLGAGAKENLYDDLEAALDKLYSMIRFENDKIKIPTDAWLCEHEPEFYSAMKGRHNGLTPLVRWLKSRQKLPGDFDVAMRTYTHKHARIKDSTPATENRDADNGMIIIAPKAVRMESEDAKKKAGPIKNEMEAVERLRPYVKQNGGKMISQETIDSLRDGDYELYTYIWENGQRAGVHRMLISHGVLKSMEQARKEAEEAVLKSFINMYGEEEGRKLYRKQSGKDLKPLTWK